MSSVIDHTLFATYLNMCHSGTYLFPFLQLPRRLVLSPSKKPVKNETVVMHLTVEKHTECCCSDTSVRRVEPDIEGASEK